MSSKPDGVRALNAKLLKGLIFALVPRLDVSGENVGVLGGSPRADGERDSGGGDLIKMGSMLAGSNVSNAALGCPVGV